VLAANSHIGITVMSDIARFPRNVLFLANMEPARFQESVIGNIDRNRGFARAAAKNPSPPEVLQGLKRKVRVTADTIAVTYPSAPHADYLRRHYEGLPNRLQQENLNPDIPWLYNYQLDFRFR
jgi:hypothetical protein